MLKNQQEDFCSQPLGPWIVGVVVTTVMLFFWVVMRREEIIRGVELETKPTPRIAAPNFGEPSFPRSVTQAVMNGPASARNYSVAAITKATPNGGMQLVKNYSTAAITKATPNGGMQLVANNPATSVFQDSLKDAVNAVIPTVCDIHARRVVRSPGFAQGLNAQNLKFVPPFDGVIDKFVENTGYENIGAGMFVDARGYILTNYHVTQEATDIMVTVFGPPSRDYHADIIAQDPNNDLALIKLRADGPFPEAQIGDSSFSQIGDYVIAVGSPFGIEQTVTSGIISGIRKSINIEGVRYKNLFQTDTPINRGSSGGPLVNLRGEVIGINTAIYAPTGVFSGTGFAIPINDCKEFLAKNLGKNFPLPVDQRGMLAAALPNVDQAKQAPVPVRFGIEAMPVDAIIAKQFGVTEGQGVLVNRVMDESPASFAGIQRGDILVAIAGVPISSKDDLSKIVAHFKTGDNVNIRILRNGRTDEFLVKIQ